MVATILFWLGMSLVWLTVLFVLGEATRYLAAQHVSEDRSEGIVGAVIVLYLGWTLTTVGWVLMDSSDSAVVPGILGV